MLKSSYQGRTYKMGVLLPMLLGVIALPPVLFTLFQNQLTSTRICYGGAATLVAFFLVIAGGQSAAIFTASPDGFVVSTTNYLLRIRRTRHFEWSDVSRVENVDRPDHINQAGANVGGRYLIVHLTDFSTIRVVGRGDDRGGYQLVAFQKSIQEGIAQGSGV